MAEIDYPRLCGGTFFTLLLQARKQRLKPRQHIRGERDGLSDSEMLIGLIKIITPDYIEPTPITEKTFKGNTSDFKSCKKSKGTYFPLDETSIFDNKVKTDYSVPLQAMCDFVNSFIDIGTISEKDTRLVKALLDLIDSDQSIDDEQGFYLSETGTSITKRELRDMTTICLQSFLLGIWHFVLTERKNNEAGKDTFDIWCPAKGGGERKYTGNMGDGITRDISISLEANPIASQTEESPIIETAESYADDEPTQAKPQVLNRPIVVNQYGTNNTQIAHVESLIINSGGG